jgi:hypothetical protein
MGFARRGGTVFGEGFSAKSGALRGLDERFPIATVRSTEFPNDEMIAGIHGADVNFLVWKDHDDPVLDVDDDALIGVDSFDGELLELVKIRFAPPGHGVARVDVNRDQLSVRFHA